MLIKGTSCVLRIISIIKNSNLVISHNELVYRSVSALRVINLMFLYSHHAANPELADLVSVRQRKALLRSYPSLRPHCTLSHSDLLSQGITFQTESSVLQDMVPERGYL